MNWKFWKRTAAPEAPEPALVDGSGVETWTLAETDTHRIVGVWRVPPGNSLQLDLPIWTDAAERPLRWWVTRTTPADLPAPQSAVETYWHGRSHHIVNNGDALAPTVAQ